MDKFKLEMMYISFIDRIRSSFARVRDYSAVNAAAIAPINHFFHIFHQQNKYILPKTKFTQTSNQCKRVTESGKLA